MRKSTSFHHRNRKFSTISPYSYNACCLLQKCNGNTTDCYRYSIIVVPRICWRYRKFNSTNTVYCNSYQYYLLCKSNTYLW